MRKLVPAAALLLLAALPAAGSAQIFLGVRGGGALPVGNFMANLPLKNQVKAELPIQLDLGLKLGPRLAVGAYAAYGVILPASAWKRDCDLTGSRCSAADLRLGVQVNLHAAGGGAAEPWGGVAACYEELRFSDSLAIPSEWTFKGFDGTLQGGVDFRVSPGFSVGPFASATAGVFTDADVGSEARISNKEPHGWVQLGLRGVFAN